MSNHRASERIGYLYTIWRDADSANLVRFQIAGDSEGNKEGIVIFSTAEAALRFLDWLQEIEFEDEWLFGPIALSDLAQQLAALQPGDNLVICIDPTTGLSSATRQLTVAEYLSLLPHSSSR